MAFPSFDQIQREAYRRWERRGHWHGRDRDDWLAAEQDLLFAMNYEVAAYYPLAGVPPQSLGAGGRSVCRFCERSAPAARFRADAPAVPTFLGNVALFTSQECDDCRALFAEGLDADLEEFFASTRQGGRASRPRLSVAALKGFAKIALSIMPRRDLAAFGDTIEWVSNPDHDFDSGLLGAAGGYLHLSPEPSSPPWVALARRTDDEAPMPSMLVFAGTPDLVVQVPVPLGALDEDLDGDAVIVPRVASPLPIGHEGRPSSFVIVPLSTSDSRRAAVLR